MKQKYIFDIYIVCEQSNGFKILLPSSYDVLEFDHFPMHKELLTAYRDVMFPSSGKIIRTVGFCSAIEIDSPDTSYKKYLTVNNVRLMPSEKNNNKKTVGKN